MDEIERSGGHDVSTHLIEYYLVLGLYYVVTEPDCEKAIRALEERMRLMEATPRWPFQLVFLIRLYTIDGQFQKAENCIRKQAAYLDRHPYPLGRLRLLQDQGHLLLRRGSYNEAIDTLEQAAHFEDGRFGGRGERVNRDQARQILAEAYIENAEYGKARRLLEDLLECPVATIRDKAILLDLLGRLHLRQKEYAKAEEFLNQAFALIERLEKENPDWMRLPYHRRFLRDLIQLYRETNRPEKAEEIIQKSGIVEENTEPQRTPKESRANE